MDQDNQVARQHARPRPRPLSRASTSSMHSATTQPNMDHSKMQDGSNTFPAQWVPQDHGNHKEMTPQQMPPDVMMLHAATHMQTPSQEFQMDGGLGMQLAHQMQYSQHPQAHQPIPQHNMPRHPLPGDQFSANGSFVEGDSQMMDVEDDESMVAMVGAPRTVGGRSSANNELEMRQLYSTNRHRKLQEVASELHGDERGPNAERSRQVFAMLWISQVCTSGKGSVPRGRVYANYASRCATERITVLNPASFGKLVRVLFPGLKTRRLGVRGESKYHYVNFALTEDQPEAAPPQPQVTRSFPDPATVSRNSSAPSTKSSNASGRPAVPSPQNASEHLTAPLHGRTHTSHSLYNLPEIPGAEYSSHNAQKTSLELSFTMEAEPAFQQSESIALPPIELYLPPGTDPDAAKSLSAVYRSHCTSLIECIRYCREKTFFHLYTSFQGTLTMPVQKLFAKPQLAAWIESSDLVLYQRMMTIISTLTLQVLPRQVMATLRSIAERLVPHIRDAFQGQPQHVVTAKEGPATLFSHLLDRALRVNLTAHAAARMLTVSSNRDQMYIDWLSMVRARKLAQCVPTRGMDDVVALLVKEMRDVIDPVDVPWELECLSNFNDPDTQIERPRDSISAETGVENVLDRWVTLLQELPERFPYASPTDIVICVERLTTSLVRDLTISQGKSFGAWWVTKVWLDEMTSFLAEQGGFMKLKTLRETSATSTARSGPAEIGVEEQQKPESALDKINMAAKISQSQPGRAPFPPSKPGGQPPPESAAEPHDDSGIGIRTPEEEFSMDRYTFSGGENGSIVAEDMAEPTL